VPSAVSISGLPCPTISLRIFHSISFHRIWNSRAKAVSVHSSLAGLLVERGQVLTEVHQEGGRVVLELEPLRLRRARHGGIGA
jgi:hypothetical protein